MEGNAFLIRSKQKGTVGAAWGPAFLIVHYKPLIKPANDSSNKLASDCETFRVPIFSVAVNTNTGIKAYPRNNDE